MEKKLVKKEEKPETKAEKLEIIEDKIIHLSEELEKLLNIIKDSLEGKDNNNFKLEENELKYKDELENYKEDNNPKISLAIYIFNLIDKIKKDMNESVDTIYSQQNFEYGPINFREINDKLLEKANYYLKIKDEVLGTKKK